MSRTLVEFEGHGGVTLRGDFYRPEGQDPVPAVVMTHGFSATRSMCLAPFAEMFCRAGLAVLVYDHRCLGASDGRPRGEINPWAQMRDQRKALSWLEVQEGVDPDRLGLWGSSFSGGEVLVLGAVDERVQAVVANVPLAGFPGRDYTDAVAGFEAIKAALLDESGQGLADRSSDPPQRLRVVDDARSPESNPPPIFLPQEESAEWFLGQGRMPGSGWTNDVQLVNAFGCDPPFDPGFCVEFIAPAALLLVVAQEDRLCSVEAAEQAFERAGEPKQLLMVPGHHFSNYQGPSLRTSAEAMKDFFLDALSGR
ncbi:alpha/beta fold hydrolase [Myxococcota bacterium]|nr:alpha/beta fold hydrolase [Myxococcota bacterium]